jgi:hypothetical protein
MLGILNTSSRNSIFLSNAAIAIDYIIITTTSSQIRNAIIAANINASNAISTIWRRDSLKR